MPRTPNPDVRGRIIAAGQRLIHSRGFNGSGVADIASAAGVPKGSFYNYFPTKEAFLVEVLDGYWVAIEGAYGPILRDRRVSPRRRVTRFFRALTGEHAQRQFSAGCLIGNIALELSDTNEAARRKVQELLGRWETALAACLDEAQSAGEVSADRDPVELARLLIEAWEGAVLRGKVEQGPGALDRFDKVVLPRLLA